MRKTSTITVLSLSLLLGACTQTVAGPLSVPLRERLQNPLVAERYWAEMTEHMADAERRKDPILKDGLKASIIDDQRVAALNAVNVTRGFKKQGISGMFLTPDINEDVEGEALLVNNTLYFGTTFITDPNPSIRVYLTTVVDPRIGTFPDKTSLDLGPLQLPYGAQQYEIPEKQLKSGFQTAVLYDTGLQKLLGFVQLNKPL